MTAGVRFASVCAYNKNDAKDEIAKKTNLENFKGDLHRSFGSNADVFIGVSAPNLLKSEDITKDEQRCDCFCDEQSAFRKYPIRKPKKAVRRLSPPADPIFPIKSTMRLFSRDFSGACLDARTRFITDKIKIKAALAIAGLVKNPKNDRIVPEVLDKRVAKAVAEVFSRIDNFCIPRDLRICNPWQ